MATHREIWERKRAIRDAFAAGQSVQSICTKFNVELHYLIGCLDAEEKKRLKKELKLSNKTKVELESAEYVQKILYQYSLGKSASSISLEMNIVLSKVNRIINNHLKNSLELEKKQARDARLSEIIQLARSGQTLKQIGEKFNLSGERIRRLITDSGISVRELRRVDNSHLDKIASNVSSWILLHPGCTVNEILLEFELDQETFSSLKTQPKALALVIQDEVKTKTNTFTKFTREEMLAALRTAYEIRNPMMGMYSVSQMQPLTGPYYEKLRKSGRISGPSLMRVLQVFGTWRKACSLADVVSVAPVRNEYELKWTRDELVSLLAEFLLQSASHSVDAFDQWCRLDESRPSSGTVRNQVGPWSSSKREALLILRERWNSE